MTFRTRGLDRVHRRAD
ncbi:predicted protein [Streptomyces iranensis]|uniref:Uncharacterized protein n=1 Tax=Streptomyces iranensis TaxID=576784 RepID=A0A060ZLK8_9ACTN|nr:predicted protein [Streptomyces iranensis]